MQVSGAASSSSWSSLAMYKRQAMLASDDRTIASGATAQAAAPETDTVVLQAAAAAALPGAIEDGTSSRPPEVFAEIWKDGVKVGTVYTDGQAVLPNMLAGITARDDGPKFAYLRAAEISRQVGGEVRYINISALQVAQTRAQLRAAYGS